MAKLVREAYVVAREWLGEVKGGTTFFLAAVIAGMALESEDHEVPRILKAFLELSERLEWGNMPLLACALEKELATWNRSSTIKKLPKLM